MSSISRSTSSSRLGDLERDMAKDPFAAPLLKLDWAKQHISDLNGKINAYLALRPFQLFIVQGPEMAQRQYRIETDPPIPTEFALIIGDTIHNLRAALDIMIFGLIGDIASQLENISFPFCKNADSVESTISGRQIRLAGERVVEAIRSLEPYPTGKHKLYAIHDMDIRDKHKLLVPVGRNAKLSEDELRSLEPGLFSSIDPKGATIVFEGDSNNPIILRIDIPRVQRSQIRPLNEPAKIQPAFTICFDQGAPLAHQAVVPVLTKFAQKTEFAISTIRAATEVTRL